MKKTLMLITGSLLFFFFTAQTQENNFSKRQAKKWFKKKEWAGGLTLTPHGSIDKRTFAFQYTANKRLWDTTFTFLRTHNLATLEKGDYYLAGDSAVVKVSYGPPKSETEAKWEAHKKFIDVQIVAAGKEKIGLSSLSKATPVNDYDAIKDNTNYTADGKYHVAKPGMFFLFFPQDVHRPGIKVEDGMVRKIVVKIMVAK